jgi:hypothetical protein
MQEGKLHTILETLKESDIEFSIKKLFSVDLAQTGFSKTFILHRDQVSRSLTVGPRDALVLTQCRVLAEIDVK